MIACTRPGRTRAPRGGGGTRPRGIAAIGDPGESPAHRRAPLRNGVPSRARDGQVCRRDHATMSASLARCDSPIENEFPGGRDRFGRAFRAGRDAGATGPGRTHRRVVPGAFAGRARRCRDRRGSESRIAIGIGWKRARRGVRGRANRGRYMLALTSPAEWPCSARNRPSSAGIQWHGDDSIRPGPAAPVRTDRETGAVAAIRGAAQ